jgi:hypothetical protein
MVMVARQSVARRPTGPQGVPVLACDRRSVYGDFECDVRLSLAWRCAYDGAALPVQTVMTCTSSIAPFRTVNGNDP